MAPYVTAIGCRPARASGRAPPPPRGQCAHSAGRRRFSTARAAADSEATARAADAMPLTRSAFLQPAGPLEPADTGFRRLCVGEDAVGASARANGAARPQTFREASWVGREGGDSLQLRFELGMMVQGLDGRCSAVPDRGYSTWERSSLESVVVAMVTAAMWAWRQGDRRASSTRLRLWSARVGVSGKSAHCVAKRREGAGAVQWGKRARN
jgi:hypothetical protein